MLTRENAAALAADFIDSMPGPLPSDLGTERGIVICGGGLKYGACAYVQIRLLRELGCTLPIELWCLDEDENDPQLAEMLASYDVVCINSSTSGVNSSHPRWNGWQLKSHALLNSRFQEVLLLDADNVPTRDPEFLFDTAEYCETGAIFWPDPPGHGTPQKSPVWEIFGLPYRKGPEQESGQLVVDKGRSWKALQLCNWYNANAAFFYKFVYGDKDTFRLAWQRLEQPFAWIPRLPDCRLRGTLGQRDFEGNVLFQHRCGAKWELYRRNKRIRGFQHEAKCLEYLEELRSEWEPQRHLLRHTTERDRLQMVQLEGKRFLYHRPGLNRWEICLGPHGRVDEGYGPNEFFWRCQSDRLHLLGMDGRCKTVFHQSSFEQWDCERTTLRHTLPQLNAIIV